MFAHRLIAAATLGLFVSTPAATLAGVGYIKSPHVEKGEVEIEYQGIRTFDDNNARDGNYEHKLEYYYGFTDRIQGAVSGKLKDDRSEDLELDGIGVEVIYEILEEGHYWLDMAALAEYESAHGANEPDKIEGKLLLAKEWGMFESKANLIVEREVGKNSADEWELGTKLGTVYQLSDYFEPGLEWHAEYGEIGDFADGDDQEHFLGPVAYGELYELPNGGGEFEYEIGYFFGLTDGSEDGAARLLLEYEAEF